MTVLILGGTAEARALASPITSVSSRTRMVMLVFVPPGRPPFVRAGG